MKYSEIFPNQVSLFPYAKELLEILSIVKTRDIEETLAAIKLCLEQYSRKNSNRMGRNAIFLSIGPNMMNILLTSYLAAAGECLTGNSLSTRGFYPPIRNFLTAVGFDTLKRRTHFRQHITGSEEHMRAYGNLFKIAAQPENSTIVSAADKESLRSTYKRANSFQDAVRMLFKNNTDEELFNLFKVQYERMIEHRQVNGYYAKTIKNLTVGSVILDILLANPQDWQLYYRKQISRIGKNEFSSKYLNLRRYFWTLPRPKNLEKVLKTTITQPALSAKFFKGANGVNFGQANLDPAEADYSDRVCSNINIKRGWAFEPQANQQENVGESLNKKLKGNFETVIVPRGDEGRDRGHHSPPKKVHKPYQEGYRAISCPELNVIIDKYTNQADIATTLSEIKEWLIRYKASHHSTSISKAFLSIGSEKIAALLTQYLTAENEQLPLFLQPKIIDSNLLQSIPYDGNGFAKPIKSFLGKLGFTPLDVLYLRRFFDEYKDLLKQFAEILRIEEKQPKERKRLSTLSNEMALTLENTLIEKKSHNLQTSPFIQKPSQSDLLPSNNKETSLAQLLCKQGFAPQLPRMLNKNEQPADRSQKGIGDFGLFGRRVSSHRLKTTSMIDRTESNFIKK